MCFLIGANTVTRGVSCLFEQFENAVTHLFLVILGNN